MSRLLLQPEFEVAAAPQCYRSRVFAAPLGVTQRCVRSEVYSMCVSSLVLPYTSRLFCTVCVSVAHCKMCVVLHGTLESMCHGKCTCQRNVFQISVIGLV